MNAANSMFPSLFVTVTSLSAALRVTIASPTGALQYKVAATDEPYTLHRHTSTFTCDFRRLVETVLNVFGTVTLGAFVLVEHTRLSRHANRGERDLFLCFNPKRLSNLGHVVNDLACIEVSQK